MSQSRASSGPAKSYANCARGTPFKVGGLFPQRFHPTPGSPNVGGWGAGRHAAALASPLPRQHDQAAHSGRLRPANPLHRSEATASTTRI